MQYTSHAFRKFVYALARDADAFRPYAASALIGALAGAVMAVAVLIAVFVPREVENATRSIEARDAARLAEATDRAYTQGALDLIEGHVTVREEIERAYILLRTPRGDIERVPLDADARRRIQQEGWSFRAERDAQTISGG